MTQVYATGFAGVADGTQIDQFPSSGAPDFGYHESSAGACRVSSNRVGFLNDGAGVYCIPAGSRGDQRVDIDVTWNTTRGAGPRARMATGATTAYYAFMEGTNLYFGRLNAGTDTGLGSYAHGLGSTGTARIGLKVTGSNPCVLTVYINNVQVGTYSDSSGSRIASGYSGFGGWDDSGSNYYVGLDNLTIDDAAVLLIPALTAGPVVTNIAATGFDVASTWDQNCTVQVLVTAPGASQPSDAAFDASTETASATANVSANVHHTGQ